MCFERTDRANVVWLLQGLWFACSNVRADARVHISPSSLRLIACYVHNWLSSVTLTSLEDVLSARYHVIDRLRLLSFLSPVRFPLLSRLTSDWARETAFPIATLERISVQSAPSSGDLQRCAEDSSNLVGLGLTSELWPSAINLLSSRHLTPYTSELSPVQHMGFQFVKWKLEKAYCFYFPAGGLHTVTGRIDRAPAGIRGETPIPGTCAPNGI